MIDIVKKSEWEYEEKRLKNILQIITKRLKTLQEKIINDEKNVVSRRKNAMKELKKAGNTPDSARRIQELHSSQLEAGIHLKEIKKLKKMKFSPYFGRIDFKEKGKEKVEIIYIGISSLIDENENLVYDWRAPISSMFYNYGRGKAEYECQKGIIKGEIDLKRQFKIENGEIEYIIDTDLKIDDEILQEILSQNTSGKMENIVTSIQKRQNQVIRDDKYELLIVQGAAGSGKTSIALHRVAFLLYRYRENITADNILIFSPNKIFSDYISNVLPELGEENMKQTTFQSYTEKYLDYGIKTGDFFDQMEYLFSRSNGECQIRKNGIEFKSSSIFFEIIKNYIEDINNNKLEYKTLKFKDEIFITKEELEKLWNEKYSYLPFKKRLLKLRRRLFYLIKKRKKKKVKNLYDKLKNFRYFDSRIFDYPREIVKHVRDLFKPLKDEIIKLTSIDIFELYTELFRNKEKIQEYSTQNLKSEKIEKICQQTLNTLTRKKLLYEDLAPYLYFKTNLTGERDLYQGVKHIIIDEAQDYSCFHYEIIKQAFPESKITLLGDLNQSIQPYAKEIKYSEIQNILEKKNSKQIKLKKSYRSTTEIVEFTRAILQNNEEIEAVKRPGNKPEVIDVSDNKVIKTLINRVKMSKEKGANSIAIVCKTAKQSLNIYIQLKNNINISLISKDDKEFKHGTVIIPSYLVKGLEFDSVIVHIDSENNYIKENERKLFYTICTRALHQLYILYQDKLTPFLTGIDQNLFLHKKM